MDGRLKLKDSYNHIAINALRPEPSRQSIAGTPIEFANKSTKLYGYNLNNNDASARWIQVFHRPASGIVVGVTPPDDTWLMPASGAIKFEAENPVEISGLCLVCTTTETGSTGATAGATGSIDLARD